MMQLVMDYAPSRLELFFEWPDTPPSLVQELCNAMVVDMPVKFVGIPANYRVVESSTYLAPDLIVHLRLVLKRID